MRFNGGSAYIDLSNNNDLNLGAEFTIEMFMLPEEVIGSSVMFGLSPVSGLSMSLSESLGDLYFNMNMNGGQMPFTLATGIVEGQWHHVALVKEPSNYKIYVDGGLIANAFVDPSADGPYNFPGSTLGTRTIGGPTGTWRGWIDEFRISDEALTPDQFLIAVPEPSTLLLFIAGGLLIACRRRSG